MSAALEDVVAKVFNIPAASVTDDLEFNGVPQWDSLNHVNLMLELEQVYGVAVGDDEMVDLTTVRAIRQFLARHADAGRPAGD
jgi:acyl carrier protein